jgi:transposase InsO family protein
MFFYYMMLKQCWKTIKRFWIDQGREYGMSELDAFCKEKGIILETTAHYTPEQNGISE